MNSVVRGLWVVGMSLIAASVASACSCAARMEEPEDAIRREYSTAKAVVSAHAIKVVDGDMTPGGVRLLGNQYVTWKVDESFKGAHGVGQRFRTTSSIDGAACGYGRISKGDAHLLYLERNEPYGLYQCGGSGPLKYLGTVLPLLRRLAVEAPARPGAAKQADSLPSASSEASREH
jgi:hypothetical protein